MPHNCPLVCVELTPHAHILPQVTHPERAVYLLGAEDHGIPPGLMEGKQCIKIPTPGQNSMNVAVAGTLVMYDRYVKQIYN